MRRFLVLAVGFLVVFAVICAITLALGSSLGVASFVMAAAVVGIALVLTRDIRRTPWSSARDRGHDAVYVVTGFAALHAADQSGTDCRSGYDGYGGCGDSSSGF